jgi:hypothetical protein
MDAASEAAGRLAVDGAHLAAAAAPTPATAARCAGAAPCPASAADALADAARGMRDSAATARVAAEVVECSPDVGGLKALLCTLRGEWKESGMEGGGGGGGRAWRDTHVASPSHFFTRTHTASPSFDATSVAESIDAVMAAEPAGVC